MLKTMIKHLQTYFINIAQKSKIPEIQNSDQEQYKLGILRLVLGIVLLVRNGEIVYTAQYMDYPDSTLIFAVCYLVILFMFTIGIALPLITPAIFFSYCFMFNKYMATGTLGDTTFLQLMAILMFLNHGYRFSIDSYFLTRTGLVARIIKALYSILGKPENKHYKTIYFYGLCAYAFVSLAALKFHLNDPHWVGGKTIHVLLINSYFFKYYEFFRYIESSFPSLIQLISYVGLIGQSLFQLFMIPLVFWKYGRQFIKLWGWTFFLMSFLAIQLSYLPHIEIIFWITIFHRFNFSSNQQITSANVQPRSGYRVIYAFIFYVITFGCFVMLHMPIISYYPKEMIYRYLGKENYYRIDWMLYGTGYNVPNVFNKSDLGAGNNWIVIERKPLTGSGKYTLVPFSGYNGERMSYFLGFDYFLLSNHGSDVLYFRLILPTRRTYGHKQNQSKNAAIQNYNIDVVKKLINFDYKYQKLDKPYTYRIKFYTTKSNDISLKPEKRYRKKLANSLEITIGN